MNEILIASRSLVISGDSKKRAENLLQPLASKSHLSALLFLTVNVIVVLPIRHFFANALALSLFPDYLAFHFHSCRYESSTLGLVIDATAIVSDRSNGAQSDNRALGQAVNYFNGQSIMSKAKRRRDGTVSDA